MENTISSPTIIRGTSENKVKWKRNLGRTGEQSSLNIEDILFEDDRIGYPRIPIDMSLISARARDADDASREKNEKTFGYSFLQKAFPLTN
ncbi:hypothetical protein EVAR_6260_1 [Eumeta japonica]|uniref:Uncharacterized protein n=1 Tax=Eumeta variegata TaxID=151549 RepID=A0A4C1T991_EUMVA|nr:hypothetical protein EVAR_6260_1 [Eumeta japonica]